MKKWERLADQVEGATMNGGFNVDEGMKWLELLLSDEEEDKPEGRE